MAGESLQPRRKRLAIFQNPFAPHEGYKRPPKELVAQPSLEEDPPSPRAAPSQPSSGSASGGKADHNNTAGKASQHQSNTRFEAHTKNDAGETLTLKEPSQAAFKKYMKQPRGKEETKTTRAATSGLPRKIIPSSVPKVNTPEATKGKGKAAAVPPRESSKHKTQGSMLPLPSRNCHSKRTPDGSHRSPRDPVARVDMDRDTLSNRVLNGTERRMAYMQKQSRGTGTLLKLSPSPETSSSPDAPPNVTSSSLDVSDPIDMPEKKLIPKPSRLPRAVNTTLHVPLHGCVKFEKRKDDGSELPAAYSILSQGIPVSASGRRNAISGPSTGNTVSGSSPYVPAEMDQEHATEVPAEAASYLRDAKQKTMNDSADSFATACSTRAHETKLPNFSRTFVAIQKDPVADTHERPPEEDPNMPIGSAVSYSEDLLDAPIGYVPALTHNDSPTPSVTSEVLGYYSPEPSSSQNVNRRSDDVSPSKRVSASTAPSESSITWYQPRRDQLLRTSNLHAEPGAIPTQLGSDVTEEYLERELIRIGHQASKLRKSTSLAAMRARDKQAGNSDFNFGIPPSDYLEQREEEE